MTSRNGASRRIQVVNIFVRVEFGTPVDLTKLMVEIPEAEYDPESAPGLIIRTREPAACVTIYRSGLARCTGCRSFEDARVAVNRIAASLRRLYPSIRDPVLEVRNIVCVFSLPGEVNLTSLGRLASGAVEYEPEQFPGAIVRIHGKGPALVFRSGRVVLTGVRTLGEAEEFRRELTTLHRESNA